MSSLVAPQPKPWAFDTPQDSSSFEVLQQSADNALASVVGLGIFLGFIQLQQC